MIKKNITAIGTVLIIAASAFSPVYAMNTNITLDPSVSYENTQINKAFTEFTGKITEFREINGRTLVRVEENKDSMIDFVVDENTVIVDKEGFISIKDLKVGDELKSVYIMPQMTIMIYPAQLVSNVLIKVDNEGPSSIKVDLFDENLLSSTKDLRLNINPENPVLDQKGNPYEGSLENKSLLIYYTIVAESMPAQTTPEKIIVMDIDKTQLDIELPEEPVVPEEPQDKIDHELVESMQFFVNKTHVPTSGAYMKGDVVMVPLRAIAEAFGQSVEWNGENKCVKISGSTTITIGNKEYSVNGTSLSFEEAPELKNELTYVPMNLILEAFNAQLRLDEGIFDLSVNQ